MDKLTKKKLQDWLAEKNRHYRQEEVPYRARPFLACQDYSQEFHFAFSFNSDLSNYIFDWFKARSALDAHALGALHTGAFYFDAHFWALEVPIIYGAVKIDPLSCLSTMPDAIKLDLCNSKEDMRKLCCYFADCVDYSLGFDDFKRVEKASIQALEMLKSADRFLLRAVSQLNIENLNTNSIMDCGMACEMFLKFVLIQERGFDDNRLKKNFGHKIKKLAQVCYEELKLEEFRRIAEDADSFLDVSERYKGKEYKSSDVWRALAATQLVGAAIMRFYTGRNIKAQMVNF